MKLGHKSLRRLEIITCCWWLKQKQITQWNENLIFLICSLSTSFYSRPRPCWLWFRWRLQFCFPSAHNKSVLSNTFSLARSQIPFPTAAAVTGNAIKRSNVWAQSVCTDSPSQTKNAWAIGFSTARSQNAFYPKWDSTDLHHPSCS